MDIRNEIIRIFEENGVDASDVQSLIDIDSVQYISIVVEIEQFLGIVLPDYILMQNEFKDFDAFVSVVYDVYEHRDEKIDSDKEEATLLYENISSTIPTVNS